MEAAKVQISEVEDLREAYRMCNEHRNSLLVQAALLEAEVRVLKRDLREAHAAISARNADLVM